MSELISVRTKDIFTTRNKNCLKNYQIENLFKKKETNHFNPNLSKYRVLKPYSANWDSKLDSAKWDSANWY